MKAKSWVPVRVCVLAAAGLFLLPGYSAAVASGTGTGVVTGKDLIINGGFSVPAVPSENWEAYPAGDAVIKGWTIGKVGVAVIGRQHYQQPPGYAQSIDLAADSNGSPGSLAQSVPTQAGVAYLLGWWATRANAGDGVSEPAVLHVLWDGKLVDSLTLSPMGHTSTSMGWAHETVVLTATSSSSSLVFADASPQTNALSDWYAPALGGVTLYAETIFENVNGFRVQKSGAPVPMSGPYGMAELQMLPKIRGTATVTSQGSPVAALTAASASQSPAGTGLVITWGEAPTSSFLQGSPARQAAGAKAVQQYLSMLLTSSYNAYQAALKAERIAPVGAAPLSKSWGVRVEGVSTAGKLMTFEVSEANPPTGAITYNEAGVPTFSGSLTAATASAALRDMLYYTKGPAAVSGPTTTSTT
jgi:hypothetical protein